VITALRRLRILRQGLVFTTQLGTPIGPRTVNLSWYAALKRIQDVRGTVGTLLLEDAEDIGIMSTMKGHASVTTTMKHAVIHGKNSHFEALKILTHASG
jgi:hypothetical protein